MSATGPEGAPAGPSGGYPGPTLASGPDAGRVRARWLVRAFLRRDWAVARSYRLPFVMNLLSSGFILIVLFQAGKLVKPGTGGPADQLGHGFFSFAVVGTMVLSIVHSASATFASKLREEQTTGTLEALLATPASPSAVILCSGLYDVLQAVTLSLVGLGMGLVLGLHLVLEPRWLALSALLLVALVALATEIGVGVAAFTVVFKRGATLSGLIGTGLALLGGVWYPVATLPHPVQRVADLIPFTWGLTALRASLLFGKLQGLGVAGLLATVVVGMPVALLAFRGAVDRARRAGTLGQY
ncbi:MAG: ABC transporter permease [Acidimicrobiales bacterium]